MAVYDSSVMGVLLWRLKCSDVFANILGFFSATEIFHFSPPVLTFLHSFFSSCSRGWERFSQNRIVFYSHQNDGSYPKTVGLLGNSS